MQIVQKTTFVTQRLVTAQEAAAALGVPVSAVQELIDEKRVLPATATLHTREKWLLHEVQAALVGKLVEATQADDGRITPNVSCKSEWIEVLKGIITRYKNASPEAAAMFIYEEIADTIQRTLSESGKVYIFDAGSLKTCVRSARKAYSPRVGGTVDVAEGQRVVFSRSRKTRRTIKGDSDE